MTSGENSGITGRDQSSRQTPVNEATQYGPSHREARATEGFILNREDEQRRRKIVEALEKGQPDKNLARKILDYKGLYSDEQINSVVEHINGIDYNEPRFIFEDKIPGRMLDSHKWKRTNVDHIVHGTAYSYQPDEPKTIRHGRHNSETSQKVTTSKPCDRGELLISRPSKEKYGYLPQFHEEVESSMPGFFCNSEDIEGYLVGGKEKLQEIRRELTSESGGESGGSRASEIPDKGMDDSALSWNHSRLRKKNKKLFTLWDVDVYENDFGDGLNDAEASEETRGSPDQHDVNRSN